MSKSIRATSHKQVHILKKKFFSHDVYQSFSKSHWKSTENRKNFLDEIAKKLNIKTPSDWGKITQQHVLEFGGRNLLFYGSLLDCLESVYKDINWKREWFHKLPNSYWKSMQNRRNFLDEVAKKLNIKESSDWGKVTTRRLHEFGGNTLLKYFNHSLFSCLQSVYPEIKWEEEWFDKLPNSYWKSIENRKKFLNRIAKQLNIKKPSDWGKVTTRRLNEFGGSTLLKYFNGSLFTCLQSVYKDIFALKEDIKWRREWFEKLPNFPKAYWNSQDNCKRFIDEIIRTYNIQTIHDWRKVSHSLIKNHGGSGLLKKYEDSLVVVLEKLYPSHTWNGLIDSKFKMANTELQFHGIISNQIAFIQ